MARLVIEERGEDIIVGGNNVRVIGTSAPGEVVTVVSGSVTFDASFNAGGDTILLPGSASDYTVRTVGAVVIFESAAATVRVPAGDVGIDVGFDDGSDLRTLVIDTNGTAPVFLIGSTVITAAPSPVNSGAPVSENFTTAVDNVVGTGADDIFTVPSSLIGAGDRLSDPSISDNDRLILQSEADDLGVIFSNVLVTNIETLVATQVGTGRLALDLGGFSGLQAIDLFSEGGSIELFDLQIDSGRTSPAPITYSGGGPSAILNIEVNGDPNQLPHPSQVTASLILKSDAVNLINYRVLYDEQNFNTLNIILQNDVVIDSLNVSANKVTLAGDYGLKVNNPVLQAVLLDLFNVGPVSMTLSNENNVVNVDSITDDWEIDAAEGSDDRIWFRSSTHLTGDHGLSGFEEINLQGEDQTYSFVFNAKHAPSSDLPLEFNANFAGEDVIDGFALTIETDTDGSQRSYSMEIGGSDGANYIDVSRGGQQDRVSTGRSDDIIFLGSPQRGPGDTLFAGGGSDRITVVGLGDTEIHTGPGKDVVDARQLDSSAVLTVYGNVDNQTLHVASFGSEDTFAGDNGIDTLIIEGENTIFDRAFTNVSGVETLTLLDGNLSNGAGSRVVELGAFAERSGLLKVELGDGGYLLRSLSFSGALEVLGGNGDDVIFTGVGSNTIRGGAGDDEIIGGGGADEISGGSGQDFFGFRLGDSNIFSFDTILDFSFSDDDRLVFEVFVDNDRDGVDDEVVFSGNHLSMEDAEAALTAGDGRVEVVYVSALSTHAGGFVYVDMNDDGQIDENDIAVLLKGIGNFQPTSFATYAEPISHIPTSHFETFEASGGSSGDMHVLRIDDFTV